MRQRRFTIGPSRIALILSVAALLIALGAAATTMCPTETPSPMADASPPTDSTPSVRLLASGRTFTDRGGGTVPYELVALDDEERIELRLGGPDYEIIWVGEIGQHHPIGVYPKYFGEAGHLLVLETAFGASMLYTAVISPSSQGASRVVYEKVSRFGSRFVHLNTEGPEAIVAISGDLFGPKTVSVYRWNGAAFELSEEHRTADLPYFEMAATPLTEPED